MVPDTLSIHVKVHQIAVSILAFHFAHYFHFVLLAGKTFQSEVMKMSESIFLLIACSLPYYYYFYYFQWATFPLSISFLICISATFFVISISCLISLYTSSLTIFNLW